MSSYGRPQDGRLSTGAARQASFRRRNDRDDRFYDDHRSRSRSRDRRYSSPLRRRTPPHDISRTPPRGHGPHNGRNNNNNDRDWDRDRSRDQQFDRDYSNRIASPTSPRRGRRSYRDRDREGYKSPSYDSGSRSRSRGSRGERPRRFAAPPNKEIMMEGLATDMTEEDITLELKQHYQVEGLTDVRVIRDRQTRQSRQFGFLRFSSLPQAQLFMERNHPLLYLYGNPSLNRDSPAKVRIVYSRERNDMNNDGAEGDWICKICSVNNYATRLRCFRCQAFRADTSNRGMQKAVNVGDNDASPNNTPSQFLLLRGLEPSVTEELLAKGVAKMYRPSDSSSLNKPPANKKGAKVASTTGDANLGAKEGTLRRVLLVRDRRTNESWRFGFAEFASVEDAMAALTRYNSFDKFTIASKPVLVSYVHSGVFVPALSPGAEEARFTFSPLANPSVRISYWDEEAFVAEFQVNGGANDGPDVNPKMKDVGSTAIEAKESTKSKKRKAEPTAMDISTAKKATPSYLQRWSNQHAELHGLEAKPIGTQPEVAASKSDKRASSDTSPARPTQSYADPNRHCCYLCSRQFKTAAEVNKHERLSNLHQTNLLNEELLTRARAKLDKHGIAIQGAAQTTEYRDRAKERRKAFGVVNKKGQQVPTGKPNGSNNDDGGGGGDDDDKVNVPVASKGASLLGKMGYVAGAGLGARGTGMTQPIAQDVYVAGVGLGAQGGKLGDAVEEAERKTRGDYASVLARTRDGARERYENLHG